MSFLEDGDFFMKELIKQLHQKEMFNGLEEMAQELCDKVLSFNQEKQLKEEEQDIVYAYLLLKALGVVQTTITKNLDSDNSLMKIDVPEIGLKQGL